MPTQVVLRALTPEEQKAIDDLARMRTAPARLVDRVRIIQAAAHGHSAGKIATSLGCSRPTVYTWVRRFNEQGLRRLGERPRPGRPHTDTAEPRAEVMAPSKIPTLPGPEAKSDRLDCRKLAVFAQKGVWQRFRPEWAIAFT